ncbi:response regulator transcription factor [Ferruginibacter albus]|uniref:response regulator transcription factor n=1 Tax=Ferruginibacter albus TaxID=2875540 RepID=UPI001CC3A293|nr:response regulator transcription factor [Ferruginibacter albus]UAY53626.1 response regulator transcription factor [Ferruginibacter albus]
MRRVAIVDDERIYLDTIDWVLKDLNNVEIVGQFQSAEELIEQFPKLSADVVIMDLGLPGISGVQAIAKLKYQSPKTQFLVLSNCTDDDVLFDALKAGADGYLLKSDSHENLKKALYNIFDGGSPVSPEIARKLFSYFNKSDGAAKFKALSEKQYQVLRLLADGLLYKEIAAKLDITIDTVKKHARNIYEKLHVRTRSEAITLYLKSA